jgi:aconitate hydratase
LLWNSISSATGGIYNWPESTYIAEPPFFQDFNIKPLQLDRNSEIISARALGIFGNSLTTDHISPAGAIKDTSPAGKYLLANNIAKADFNSYGSRRGNHDVMIRGTFANVRIKNLMIPGSEGGVTLYQSEKSENVQMSIYDAAMKYMGENKPTIIFGGEEYGTGSSRDWAAKGSALLGVRAVVTESFERIHRANLVFMGVLPLIFKDGVTRKSLKLDGSEVIDLTGIEDGIKPRMDVQCKITRTDGSSIKVALLCRVDTLDEVDYYLHGGILQYVLRKMMKEAA